MSCDDSMKVENEEDKTDMSELKIENLSKSLDEEESRNDEENVSSRDHCNGKKNKIIKDENKALIYHQNANITDKNKKEILEKDSDCVELFDVKKIIDRNNASDVYHNKVGVKNNDNRNKVADSRAEIVRNKIGNVKETCDENIKDKYCHKFEFHNEKSCCNKYLAHVYKLVMLDIRNRPYELEDNRVKGKNVKVKTNVDKEVMN
ncbi:5848_t:CDS:2 [Racocetra fulgida]|uniref:5848_t:CDS:1 n=1 Tax=Racocetra fulgida TaxID=60492 RepID=A0A9N9F8P8_9GLOM|nr:5848_t:CDS:2 [Racocetra fulgida]